MKNYIYRFGAFALALGMSGLPAVALAENGGGEGQGDRAIQVTSVQVQTTGESSREQQKQQLEQEKNALEASSSNRIGGEEGNGQEIELELEDDSDVASSGEDLKQKIEIRKNELAQEVASTTAADQNIVENANEVRLAVHALLSSKELLGGIGPQVSEIAKQMNDSVATTTNVEAKIQSRGFITRLFFGGDSAAADVIAQEAAKNQQRIDDLTNLLAQANVSTDVQTVLKAQITALQAAQARLADLAQREQNMWGLFSWRLFKK